MKADIRLEYRRIGTSYSGVITVQVETTSGHFCDYGFVDYPYSRMMSRLAKTIQKYDEVTVVFVRTELKYASYELDQKVIALLRSDPALAIRSMSVEPIRVIVRDKPTSLPAGLLRVGHGTLAASFGDEVYCAVRSDTIECPVCGRWSRATVKDIMCMNPACFLRLRGKRVGVPWFAVKTEDVLGANAPRYFLPRPWNPSGGWITREELSELYRTFQKEREECSQASDQ